MNYIGRFENDISTTTSWACHKRSSKQLTSLSAIYGFPYIWHQKLNKGFTKLRIWQLMFYVVSLEILRNTSISIKIFDQRALKHCLKQICQGSRASLKEWWRPGYGVFVCTRSSTITSPLKFWTWLLSLKQFYSQKKTSSAINGMVNFSVYIFEKFGRLGNIYFCLRGYDVLWKHNGAASAAERYVGFEPTRWICVFVSRLVLC